MSQCDVTFQQLIVCTFSKDASDAPIGTTPASFVKGGMFCGPRMSHSIIRVGNQHPAQWRCSVVLQLTCEQAMQATDSGWLSQLWVRAAHVVMSYQVPLKGQQWP